MVVDHESEVRVDGRIHNSHSVRRILGDGNRKASADLIVVVIVTVDIGAVDETVVQSRGTASLGRVVKLVDSLVTPVVQEDMTEILVVVSSGGTVDDNTAKDTLPGLQGKVRMIPGGTVLLRLPCISD